VGASDDCTDIIEQIEKLKDEEFNSDKAFYEKIMARAIIKRAACCFWLSNYKQAIEDYDKVIHTIRYAEILGE
jgi:hypothetical protein